MGAKTYPHELRPVRELLNRHGFGPLHYGDDRLRRDRNDLLIPLPGQNGVSVEDAFLAAWVSAKVRSEGRGHLCPAIAWNLLALNPEPKATARLRKELATGVDEVTQRGLSLSKARMKTWEDSAEYSREKRRVFRAELTKLVRRLEPGPARERMLKDVAELFPEPAPVRRSPASAYRTVGRVLDAAWGRPLSSNDVAALTEATAGFDDAAGALRDFILEQEGVTDEVAAAAVAKLTDSQAVRRLVQETPDDQLRETALRVCSLQGTGVTSWEHNGQACKRACENVAWLLCCVLDPALRKLWEVYNAGPTALVQRMLELWGKASQSSASTTDPAHL
ncbi:hypothetical protein [Streptomyces sp. JW3]|uniref:hypothetical protein n=1 Tax=Streptomyces sp. JW3 TaxID=3456955 RepID=UPI003FA40EC8